MLLPATFYSLLIDNLSVQAVTFRNPAPFPFPILCWHDSLVEQVIFHVVPVTVRKFSKKRKSTMTSDWEIERQSTDSTAENAFSN